MIVPAYNEAANIAATVHSLVRSSYPWFEVIVVDDGSTDATAAIVAGLGLPGVRLIRQANAGKPAALNTGIRAARGELLVLVDGDTVFEPEAVEQLVRPFADPEVGAVSGNTKVINRRGLLGQWQHLEYVIGFNLDRRLLLPLCAPAVDVYLVYGLLFLPGLQVVAVWLAFTLLQMATAAYALRLDRESLRPLWTLPLQSIGYRQLMYLVVVQSTVTALAGMRLRWHPVTRTGAAREAVESHPSG